MVVFSRQPFVAVVALLGLLAARTVLGDTVKDALDTAKDDYATAQEQAEKNLDAAFESQVKILSQGGDLDAVEALIAQRKAFAASKTIPTASSMRAAAAIYSDALASNELRLKAAYETAIADYTKGQRFDDAVETKRLLTERFPPAQSALPGTPGTIPADPIQDALQSSKREFISTVKPAYAALLAVIEKRANDAADKGDLDGFKRYNALEAVVLKDIVVPADFKDTVIQGANAKFVRTAEIAYAKLRAAYQKAISDYTKARRIAEAEAVKAEMGDGGWFENYTGAPSSVDLLKSFDIAKNTIRPGWKMNNGILEPAASDVEHGPWLEIPVSVNGSYEAHVVFTLSRAPEALYIHVPVGKKWGLLVLASDQQTFENIQGKGQLFSHEALSLTKDNDALFRVTISDPSTVKFELVLNGKSAIQWEGPVEKVVNGGGVWNISDDTCFGVGTKSATISQMQVTKK